MGELTKRETSKMLYRSLCGHLGARIPSAPNDRQPVNTCQRGREPFVKLGGRGKGGKGRKGRGLD